MHFIDSHLNFLFCLGQCRNVTPCLSYSRFHLDTVNLLPFVQSFVNGDAPEIDHEEVLWNLTSELIKRVDGVFDEVQTRVKSGRDEGDIINSDVVDTVNTLRTLRHFVREIARREEIRQVVKGTSEATKGSEEHNFGMLVDDVDMVCQICKKDLLCLIPKSHLTNSFYFSVSS